LNYQTFRLYYTLSLDEKVEPFLCKTDSEHGILVPNMANDDSFFMYCLDCNYKVSVGLSTYDLMYNRIQDYIKAEIV
jgi:hypothetical protein